MKKYALFLLLTIAALTASNGQTVATPSTDNAAASATRTNTAIVPVQRPDQGARARTTVVLQRAKDNQGACDIVFIGDSITHGWENAGRNVWNKYYGSRKCLNFGVGGDRTQHVLWRFENGQLDGVKPKAAVLMIGTNNSNREDNTEGEILEGVQTIVKQMRDRMPDTKILVLGIFPRGEKFTPQRGKILQVNQALARVADDKNVFYLDFGSELVQDDGSISRDVMPDFLHLSERGYEIWAQAIEPKLAELVK
ncbi:MAG TPA: platelet-activating factor acetylhydrolase IB subunit [Verrucomicrobiae bacterium]|nr:platelet-activating factor acetylhydrolase IB subunit [Verrucomicrobiae bacterium]